MIFLFHLSRIFFIFYLLFSISCSTPKPIEYRRRSGLESVLGQDSKPNRVEYEDKIIVWEKVGNSDEVVFKKVFGDDFTLENTDIDGNVILNPVLPKHVLQLLSSNLKKRKYDLIWTQLLTISFREKFISNGITKDTFQDWCQENRNQIIKSADRMISMWGQSAVQVSRERSNRRVYVSLRGVHKRSLIYPLFCLTRDKGSSVWKIDSFSKL